MTTLLVYATSTFPIMHLINLPQKFCITVIFSFLLGITAIPREIENNAYAKLLGANKVHYGKVAYIQYSNIYTVLVSGTITCLTLQQQCSCCNVGAF